MTDGTRRFIFFKLQDAVFVLLPTDGEIYGFLDEYLFFDTFIHLLFWGQSVVSASLFKGGYLT